MAYRIDIGLQPALLVHLPVLLVLCIGSQVPGHVWRRVQGNLTHWLCHLRRVSQLPEVSIYSFVL